MAEAAAPSLGDFFKAKSKKKVKASNLNKAEEKKVEAKTVKTSKEDDAWEEEQVVAATIKVEVAGKLMREEEKKDDEDTSAPAWGNISKTKENSAAGINERKYPTLAKSVGSSAINVDDGSDAKVNITVSKNVFAALEGDEDEDEGNKRPKEIKPAMVTKKKGEREKVALQREVDKYSAKKAVSKKKAKKEDGEDDDDEDDEDEEEASEEEEEVVEEKAPEKKEKVKKEKAEKPSEKDEERDDDLAEDLKIQVDLVESKEKYKGRKKLAPKDLPREELQEEKENKPQQQASGKKKKFVPLEEETDKKLQYADW